MFQNWFGSRSKSRPAPARTVKPCLECLDDRILLSANLLVNEVVVNPPAAPDTGTGTEYIELRVAPGQTADFTNTWVVALEGESGGTTTNNPGLADRAIKLSDFTSGYAGQQFIVITGEESSLETTTGANGMFVIKLEDFELENGSMSVAVLQTAAPIVDTHTDAENATDLDVGDNGVIDSTIGMSSVTLYDAVGYRENPGSNPDDEAYGFNVTPPGGGNPPDPDVMFRDADYTTSFSAYIAGTTGGNTNNPDDYNDANEWYAAELAGEDDDPPPYMIDEVTFGDPTTAPTQTTPGAANN